MDNAKNQIADKLKSSNNILLTVSRNPSVDQLSALLGLTLILNKLDKHATAVYSGETPSVLEFLKPEETLEKNTDSLRDFIISLDKTKADKLRYKVEDNVVRIFITPFRTSISEDDFDFSQGDFNVDVVVAIGVAEQDDIDEAITAHGRILHDAVVATINTTLEGGLGSINWHDAAASSLSELVVELGEMMGENLFDNQVATALLTGIVAETDRFSNEKTSSETMRASAALMAAGADQQLVAAKLSEPTPEAKPDIQDIPEHTDEPKSDDGMIEIDHDDEEPESKEPIELPQPEEVVDESPQEEPQQEPEEPKVEEVKVEQEKEEEAPVTSGIITEPPMMGGKLTANTEPENLDPSTDPLSMLNADDHPILSHKNDAPAEEAEQPQPEVVAPEVDLPVAPEMTPPPADWMPPASDPSQTLADLEASVRSQEDVAEEARDEVSKALNGAVPSPEPIVALNAQPLGGELHAHDNIPPMEQPIVDADPTAVPESKHVEEHPEIEGLQLNTDPGPAPSQQEATDPNAPPSVPPPIPFQFGTPQTPQQQN